MERRIAVYAGSFDPPTIGHVWMIEQGTALFDELVVAIGVNPSKKALFSVEERLEMLRESIQHIPGIICIESFVNQFLVNYAKSVGAKYILRGIRTESDYEYERVMYHVNAELNSDIKTVFLMTPKEIGEVSSSMVKGMVGPKGWENVVGRYVSESVFLRLKDMYHSKK